MAYLGEEDLRLVLGTAADVPSITPDDAGLRRARDLLGDGSELFESTRARLAQAAADAITSKTPRHWNIRTKVFERMNPELGPEVRRRMHDAAAEIVMGAVGAWLEVVAPWALEEVDPYRDAPFVCPGCQAVGDEHCAAWCPDASIARELEERERRYLDSGDGDGAGYDDAEDES